MDEIGEITDYVQEEAGYGTDLVWGNCSDSSLGEKISITLIATGFGEGGNKRGQVTVEEKIIVSLDDEENSRIEKVVTTGHAKGDKAMMVDFDMDDVKRTIDTIGVHETSPAFDLEDIPETPSVHSNSPTNEAAIRKNEMEAARREYLRNQATKPLDNPQIISEMENVPAYQRRKVSLEESKDNQKDGRSNHKVSVDDDAPILNNNNSFLHDNID